MPSSAWLTASSHQLRAHPRNSCCSETQGGGRNGFVEEISTDVTLRPPLLTATRIQTASTPWWAVTHQGRKGCGFTLFFPFPARAMHSTFFHPGQRGQSPAPGSAPLALVSMPC